MSSAESQIMVEGDPNAVDSFAACLTAVLRAWGRAVSYEQVEGLSGMAFSPIHNTGEDCIGWQMDGAQAHRIDFLGRSLGFTVERLGYEGGNGWLEEYGRSGAVPSAPAGYFAGMCAALQAGKAVIVRTWPAWSVLVGWDDDLRKLPFATTPRFDKVVASIYPPCKTSAAFALTRAAPEIGEREATAQALAFGSRVASGDLSRDTAEVRFGGASFDAIIALTGERYLCPNCQENGCFDRSLKRIHDGQRASISFLDAARQHVAGPAGQRGARSVDPGLYRAGRDHAANTCRGPICRRSTTSRSSAEKSPMISSRRSASRPGRPGICGNWPRPFDRVGAGLSLLREPSFCMSATYVMASSLLTQENPPLQLRCLRRDWTYPA